MGSKKIDMKRIISDREKVLRAKYPQITDEEWELIVEGLKKMSFEQVMAHIMKNGPEVDGIITAL